ncbi:MAG: hypothetical protein JJT81_15535 [Rubellimicrobium sp.]|nr:hypothetical protein [Rubellimicrobium sp.]
MSKTDDKLIHYALGRGSNLGKARNVVKSWRQFKDSLREPVRTPESFREYCALPQDEQVKLKGAAGWFFRTQVEGKNRRRGTGKPSDLITLDLDYATPEFIADLLAGKVLPGTALCVNSTRRHSKDKPRLRMTIPGRKPIENDHYAAASRIVAYEIDPEMTLFDKVSFRPAQMMFMPTASKNGEYLFYEQDGKPIDWEALLDTFDVLHGDWRNHADLPTVPDERLRETAEKAENPREKKGIVGDFCRAYDIFSAMEELIPGTYIPSDEESSKPRYTYAHSTSANGAVVEDDGDFLFSHHGSDPCADQLVNAWDMVRIHKFGDLDDENDHETPIGKRPSFKAMVEFAQGLEKVRRQQMESRYAITDLFSEDDVEEALVEEEPDELDEPEDKFADLDDEAREIIGLPARAAEWTPPPHKVFPPGAIRVRPEKDWHLDLETDKDGRIKSTASNLALIAKNDLRLSRSFAYDEASRKIVLRRDLDIRQKTFDPIRVPDPKAGVEIEDFHAARVQILLSAPAGGDRLGWGINPGLSQVRTAIEEAARVNSYHSVKDTLFEKPWNGQKKMERLFIDLLGTPDDVYHREAARLFCIATVARVFEPGHKWDYVPIIEGPQGIGKSTFVHLLAMGFSGALTANFKDAQKLFEATIGSVIVELPELSSMRRSDVEDVKAYITQTSVTLRQAYGHYAGTIRRGFTLVGTTNTSSYLVDRTGNRRFWPIRATVDAVDFDWLRENAQQIWAEARHEYLVWRKAHPKSLGDLPLVLSPEADAIVKALQGERLEENEVDHYAGLIGEWIIKGDSTSKFNEKGEEPIYAQKICIPQLTREVFEQEPSRTDRMMSLHIGQALRTLGWIQDRSARFPGIGKQKAWVATVNGIRVKTGIWVRKYLESVPSADDSSDDDII